MKRFFLLIILNVIAAVFLALPITAQNVTGDPFSTETQHTGFISVDNAQLQQKQQKTWTQKYREILKMAERRGLLDKKIMSKVSENLDKQLKQTQQDTTKIALAVKEQAQKIAADIGNYSLHFTKKEDGSWLRWFNGKLTGIVEFLKDNSGNAVTKVTTAIEYPKSQQMTVNFESAEFQPTEYKVITYHLGKADYDYAYGIEYRNTGDVADKPSKEIHKKKTLLESDIPVPDMKTTDEINNALATIDNNYLAKISNTDTLETTETRFDITYSTLNEELANPAGAAKLGNIYGQPTSYSYELSRNDGSSETGSLTQIKYYLKPDLHPQKRDELWWHARNAGLQFRHFNQQAIIGEYINAATSRGISKEIRFDNAVIDSNNRYSGYRERTFINSQETETHSYSNITYNSNGYIDSYDDEVTVNDLSSTARYWGFLYNNLGQTTAYWYRETVSGTTNTYHYYDYVYNNLWQATSYKYTKNGTLHTVTDISYENGLVKKYTDISTSGGITTTIIHENFYNSNGLITSYIEKILEQDNENVSYTYILVDDISYDSYYRITGFKQVSIRNSKAAANQFPDYYNQSITIMNSLDYNGSSYDYTAIDMTSLGFDSNYEIFTEFWTGFDYGAGYSLVTDFFRGSLRHYNKLLRTTTMDSEGKVTDTFEQTNL